MYLVQCAGKLRFVRVIEPHNQRLDPATSDVSRPSCLETSHLRVKAAVVGVPNQSRQFDIADDTQFVNGADDGFAGHVRPLRIFCSA